MFVFELIQILVQTQNIIEDIGFIARFFSI